MRKQTKKELALMFKLIPVILILAWIMMSFIHKTPIIFRSIENNISGKIKQRINEEVNKVRSEKEKKSNSEQHSY